MPILKSPTEVGKFQEPDNSIFDNTYVYFLLHFVRLLLAFVAVAFITYAPSDTVFHSFMRVMFVLSCCAIATAISVVIKVEYE